MQKHMTESPVSANMVEAILPLIQSLIQERDQLKQLLEKLCLPTEQTRELLSSDEAAAYLGVSKSTFYKLSSRGEITKYCPGGKLIFFKKEDLDAYQMSKPYPKLPK